MHENGTVQTPQYTRLNKAIAHEPPGFTRVGLETGETARRAGTELLETQVYG